MILQPVLIWKILLPAKKQRNLKKKENTEGCVFGQVSIFELAHRRRFRYQVKTENTKNSKNSHWPQTQKHQIWAYSKNFQNRLRIWEKRKNGKCRRLNQNERNRIIYFYFFMFLGQNSRNFGTINFYHRGFEKI